MSEQENELLRGEIDNNQMNGAPRTNRRLMIEKIALENFKSYYGRKVIYTTKNQTNINFIGNWATP
jgi:hypothetical protein